MRIRLDGTRPEIAHILYQLRRKFRITSVSTPHPNRGRRADFRLYAQIAPRDTRNR
ncbi:DUF3970 family protein [Sphaerisporangium perillae]|uniref:DUF3970 family protein n=1 Tax=Sphaerisporangium perillae TaxID=2935860 RepID=UPI00200C02AA|nr:DUF3970 family protein [Sphaerisporangium perillae]